LRTLQGLVLLCEWRGWIIRHVCLRAREEFFLMFCVSHRFNYVAWIRKFESVSNSYSNQFSMSSYLKFSYVLSLEISSLKSNEYWFWTLDCYLPAELRTNKTTVLPITSWYIYCGRFKTFSTNICSLIAKCSWF